MRIALAIAALALSLVVIPARADTVSLVDYSLSVVNAPGVGDFSWTVETEGFIPAPATPFTYDYLFTAFKAESGPSKGGGCGISGVWLIPGYGTTTLFTPLCDGLYGSTVAGGVPEPGVLGTFSWQGADPDGSANFVTLTISDPMSDPVSTPEPSTWVLLACGLGLMWIVRKVKGVR